MLLLLLSVFVLMLLCTMILMWVGIDATTAWYISLGAFLIVFLIVSMGMLLKELHWSQQKNKYVDTDEYEKGNYSPTIKNPGIELALGERITYLTKAIYIQTSIEALRNTSTKKSDFRKVRPLLSGVGLKRNKQTGKQDELVNGLYCVTTERLLFISNEASIEIRADKAVSIKRTGAQTFQLAGTFGQKDIMVPKKEIKYALELSQRSLQKADVDGE